MMWLVQVALRRPLTVAVMAMLMMVIGVMSFFQMNVDIFPAINLPVVMVVWNYPGLAAFQVERQMVWISERAYSTTVNDIDHIESESINGLGILRVYFHPGAELGSAIAQINAVSETILTILPRGTQPPQIISYDASNLPVAQLNLSSEELSEQQLFDYGLNFVRIQLFTIPGFSTPAPLGGVQRAIMVNLDPLRLYAVGMSPQDVGQALASTNIIIPSGTAKMGNYDYVVDLNMSPESVPSFNTLPVKVVGETPVRLGDIAPVSDTHQPQTNVVRVNGRRGSFLMVIKHANASTLSVVKAVRQRLPSLRANLPPALKSLRFTLTFDQSAFVRAALWEVVQESGVAAVLVSLMVLVFLGSARSMLIVIASIPLSILTAIIGLRLSGQTINTMTLGGIALAVGMLVDDATVEVENIHRNHAMGKPILQAILDGASQIATPTLVGTLAICIVFSPVMLLTGVAKFLFTPLALAVVYAMLTSYLLSRTLVPTMANYLIREQHGSEEPGRWARFHTRFERRFERFRDGYALLLAKIISARRFAIISVFVLVLLSFGLVKFVGEDFFPAVDAGMMRLHVRAPTGTRIEHTEQIVDDVERAIRGIIPAAELQGISDNIGLPVSYDLAFYQTDTIGPMDADILIQLTEKHRPTAGYQQQIRDILAARFPNVTTYFQPADLVGQVLNFGLPSAIDVQISGAELNTDYQLAARLRDQMREIPGLNDIRIAEPIDYPAYHVDVDRTKALQMGISQQQVASSLLTALSGSSLLTPNFWLDPHSGVVYNVISQVRQPKINSVQSLENIPLTSADAEFRAATVGQHLNRYPDDGPGRHRTLHAAEGDRHQCQRHGPRSGQRIGRRGACDFRPGKTAPRPVHHHTRTKPIDAAILSHSRFRHTVGRAARLSAYGRQLPVVARTTHYYARGPGSFGRRTLDVGHYQIDDQRRVLDGNDHGRRGRSRQWQFADYLRQRFAGRRLQRGGSRHRGWSHSPAAHPDDSSCDGARHAADGARYRLRLGTQRSSGTRGHRRLVCRHRRNLICSSRRVLDLQPRTDHQARTRRESRRRPATPAAGNAT